MKHCIKQCSKIFSKSLPWHYTKQCSTIFQVSSLNLCDYLLLKIHPILHSVFIQLCHKVISPILIFVLNQICAARCTINAIHYKFDDGIVFQQLIQVDEDDCPEGIKPMSWNSATKCWDEVKTPSSGMPGAVVSTAPTLLLIPQPTTYTTPTNTDAKTDAKEHIHLLRYSVWPSLYSAWIFFSSTLSSIDYYIVTCLQQILCTCSNFFISLFYCLLNLVENNVKVEFFIYCLLFAVAIIPIILIHTKYYTLPYSYRGRSRKRKPKRKLSRPIILTTTIRNTFNRHQLAILMTVVSIICSNKS